MESLTSLFLHAPLAANLALFAFLAGVLWLAGTGLAYLADAIAEKTAIERALIGLVFLAAVTELPELVTTLAASIEGNASLVLNNMFGGITMQTAVLAVADMTAFKATMTSFPRKPTPIVEGLFLILLLACILIFSITGDVPLLGSLGLGSVVLAAIYGVSIRFLQRYEAHGAWRPIDMPSGSEKSGKRQRSSYESLSLKKLSLLSGVMAVLILICGTVLVYLAEALAAQTGLGSSFIGVSFLAAATSLPELSTTIAAVRIHSYTMAISNIFGSNMIMAFLLLPADIFYREGLLIDQADASAKFALVAGIAVTVIYCIGLLARRNVRILGMGADSFLVLLVYLGSLYVLYHLR